MNYKMPIAAISMRNHYATLPTRRKYNLLCLYRLDNCVVVVFFSLKFIYSFFLFALSKSIAYGISFFFRWMQDKIESLSSTHIRLSISHTSKLLKILLRFHIDVQNSYTVKLVSKRWSHFGDIPSFLAIKEKHLKEMASTVTVTISVIGVVLVLLCLLCFINRIQRRRRNQGRVIGLPHQNSTGTSA